MTVTADGVEGLKELAGRDLGQSDWLEITQDRVNTFANATDDHQWIHVDTERAAAGPFGGTIAHGYLTLSLLIPQFKQLLTITGTRMAVNYGLNKVRFPSPVKVGSKIRLRATVAEAKEIGGDGVELVIDFTVEIAGADKPAGVAQAVYRHYA